MRLWTDFFPDLLVHVPGCPQPLAEHELRRAAQAFIGGAGLWSGEVGPLVVMAGDPLVAMVYPAGSEAVRIEGAWLDGRQIGPVTPESLDAQYSNRWSEMTGTPECYYQPQAGVVRLFPIPEHSANLMLRALLRPSDASIGLPDEMGQRWGDAVVAGAKARLMVYPGRTWTNAELAGVYAQAFSAMLDGATALAARAQVRARIPSSIGWC